MSHSTEDENLLEVLGSFSPAVKPKKGSVDLAKTYRTKFAQAAQS